jgi:hypothetical protein
MTRTFSNSLEAILFPILLYLWLHVKGGQGWLPDRYSLSLTAILTVSFVMRNTSVVPWLLPMLWKVFAHKTFWQFVM